uniref:PDZ domain-containing protein n=1 Tax=Bodo saltans TaxID=75058 RepID=B6DTB0_BODSA|nr:hypothetical protein [Bodo saltans]
MSSDLAKSLRMASSLSLHELQHMSRGDLIHACNVLHSGWMHVRQQVEQSALKERLAAKEAEESRLAHSVVQEEFERYVAKQSRTHSALETKHNALHREHLRLQTLLHKVDSELTSQSSTLAKLVAPVIKHRSLSFATSESDDRDDHENGSYGTDIENVASEGEDDHTDVGHPDGSTGRRSARKPPQPQGAVTVKVSPAELEDLLSTIRSSKFRIADLEDSLMLSKSETIKLERSIRQRRNVDTSMLEFRVEQLEGLLAKAHNETQDAREKLLRSDMTAASLRAELASHQENSNLDDGSTSGYQYPMEQHASMLSAASWTTATPTGGRRRGVPPPRTGSGDRSFGIRTHDAMMRGGGGGGDDDAFGSILSTSTGVQTESLVLQNVELLYKLQRDLMDLRTQRAAFQDDAARHVEERLILQQRIEVLEHDLAQKESQLVDAMEKRKRVPVSTYTRNAIVLGSNHGSFAADPRAAAPTNGDDASSTPVEEIYGVVPGLRRTIDEQAEEIAKLKTVNFDQVVRIEEMESRHTIMKESEHHLTKEVNRLTHAMSEIAEENARLQLCAALDNKEASEMITREQSLRTAENRIGELEVVAEDHETAKARIIALEAELMETSRHSEDQKHRILQLVAERNDALQECRELAEMLSASDDAKGSSLAGNALTLHAHQLWTRYVVAHVPLLFDHLFASHDIALQKAVALSLEMQKSFLGHTARLLGEQRNQFLSQRIESEVTMRRANSMRDFRPAQHVTADLPRRLPTATLTQLALSGVSVQTSPLRSSRGGSPVEEAALESSIVQHYPMSTNSSVAAFATTSAFDRTVVAALTTGDSAHHDDHAGGIGIELIEVEGALVIDTVTHNSAAYHAGLKASDCVLCVDGAVVNTLDEFAEIVMGKRSCVLSVVAGGGKALLAGEALSDSLLRNLEEVPLDW